MQQCASIEHAALARIAALPMHVAMHKSITFSAVQLLHTNGMAMLAP